LKNVTLKTQVTELQDSG